MSGSYARNISFSLAASVVAKIVGGISSFLVARILQPADFGLWLTMTLIVSYSPILAFGTVETLLKQLPFFRKREEAEEAKKLEGAVLAAISMSAVLTFAVGTMLSVSMRNGDGGPTAAQVLLMTVAASLGFPSALFYYRFIAYQDFRMVGFLESFRAVLFTVLVVLFSYRWGLAGAATGFCLTEVVVCGASYAVSTRNHGGISWNWDLGAIARSVGVGLPITIFWWLFMVQGSVDRLVSISLLGKEKTGYYGLGISIVSVVYLLPQAISRVFYPRMNEKVGVIASENELYRITIVPSRIIAVLVSGLVGVSVIVMPIVYEVLPKYRPGLAAGQVLLMFSMFRLLTTNGINFLNATNRQIWLCVMVMGSLLVGLAASFGAVWLRLGIEGLAASTSLSGIFLSVGVWMTVFAAMGFSARRQVVELLELHVPFALMAGIIGMCSVVLPRFVSEPSPLAVVYALVFVVLYVFSILIVPTMRRTTAEVKSGLRAK